MSGATDPARAAIEAMFEAALDAADPRRAVDDALHVADGVIAIGDAPVACSGQVVLIALGKAAVTLCQCDARQEAIRGRLVARLGKAKANVAMARRLLRILYAMMRDEQAYQGGPRRDRTAAANRARLRRKKQVA